MSRQALQKWYCEGSFFRLLLVKMHLKRGSGSSHLVRIRDSFVCLYSSGSLFTFLLVSFPPTQQFCFFFWVMMSGAVYYRWSCFSLDSDLCDRKELSARWVFFTYADYLGNRSNWEMQDQWRNKWGTVNLKLNLNSIRWHRRVLLQANFKDWKNDVYSSLYMKFSFIKI